MRASVMLDLSPGAGLVLDGREWAVEWREPELGRVQLFAGRNPTAGEFPLPGPSRRMPCVVTDSGAGRGSGAAGQDGEGSAAGQAAACPARFSAGPVDWSAPTRAERTAAPYIPGTSAIGARTAQNSAPDVSSITDVERSSARRQEPIIS